MSNLVAKEYLGRIKKINTLIMLKRNELESIKASMEYQSPSFDERVSGGIKKTQEDKIIKYIEYAKELETEEVRLMEQKQEILKTIESVNKAEVIQILYKRYFEFKEWEEICVEVGYSWKQTMRYHSDGLDEVTKLISTAN